MHDPVFAFVPSIVEQGLRHSFCAAMQSRPVACVHVLPPQVQVAELMSDPSLVDTHGPTVQVSLAESHTTPVETPQSDEPQRQGASFGVVPSVWAHSAAFAQRSLSLKQ
jgi:hypothetical protein